MTKETISNGIDSYNKKLAEAEDYYKDHLQDNLKRIKETSQKIEEFASGKYDDEIASFGDDEGAYNQADSAGFINLFGLPIKVQAKLNEKLGK